MGVLFIESRFRNRPSLQLKLVHCAGTGVTIKARTTQRAISDPRIILKNLRALQDKGYYIGSLNSDERYDYKDINYCWVTLGSIKTEKTLEEFRNDCKESGVHVEFYAEYNTGTMRKEVTTRQTQYWHNNITAELGPAPQLK